MNLALSDSAGPSVLLLILTLIVFAFHIHWVYAPCDDAYIYLVYVNSLFQGKGLTYNGEIVQGFSSLLWPWLISLVHWAGSPLPNAIEQLSWMSGLVVIGLSYFTARRLGLTRIHSVLPGFILACTGDFAFYTGNGLETILFSGLVLSVGSLLFEPERWVEEGRSWSWFFQFMLLCLIRPEGIALTILMIAILTYQTRNTGACLTLITRLALVLGPTYGLIRLYYGNWLPATYHAKSGAGLANLGQGIDYSTLFLRHYWLIFSLVGLGLIFRHTASSGRWKTVALLIVLWVAQVTLQGGDNMVGFRMYVPILPLLYLTIIYSLRQVDPSALLIGALIAGGYIFFSYNFGTVIGSSWQTPVKQHAQIWRTAYNERRDRGLWLKANLPPDSRVALSAAGITPFYSELPTLDMLGLNNRHIALEGHRDRHLTYGHQAGDGSYILDQHPDVIFFSDGLKPGKFLSDREIWADARFKENYVACQSKMTKWGWFRKDIIPALFNKTNSLLCND